MRFVPPVPRRSATAVHAALAAQVLTVAALVVFEHVRGRRLAGEISALGGDPHAPGAQAVVGAVTVFAILVMLVAVAAFAGAAAYLTWLVQARQRVTRSWTPALPMLAAWLVPGVNLVVPPLLVHRLWRDSRPPADRRARWLALLAAWWLSWLATLAVAVARLPFGAPHGDSDLTGLGLADLAVVTLAALLCAATVRQITTVQTAAPHDLTRALDAARGQSQARISSQPSPAVSKRNS
ncbi:DUF4328 domain-containing protein [Streptosporangium saharense]|uniref:DUF4328 domain-containing protein n=1 Tax=Streptosporangium saharense TaxID=1706840 RepID=A0A7W7VRK9_9ACTN|nr:DUF4328 domain-containing protein [Streptosporangium saharense]MBB4920206.1 hypothetical protein [Streptosporangium saharense]